MRNETILKFEGLQNDYSQKVLLEVAREYSKKMRSDKVQPVVYYETISRLIKAIEKKELDLVDLVNEAILHMKHYDLLIYQVHKKRLLMGKRRDALNYLQVPIVTMQVIYILKHRKYKNLGRFMAEGHNKSFQEAMGVE